MVAGVRVYDKRIKKVGEIQSVKYYDPVDYYQRLFGSWPNKNFDSINVRFDGENSDTIYNGESCANLQLESATAGSAYSKLVLWHDFEETAGTVIGDWKGNVHSENKPASAVATKSTTSAVGDRCLVFNGTDQYTLGGVTNMPNDKMSFSFWIKTTDTAGTIFSFGGGGSNNVERAVKLNAGKIELFEKNGAPETSLLSSGTVNDDSWHHIVCTIAGISSVWKIYVDKVDVSASTVNGPGNTNLAVLQTTIAVSYVNAALSNYYAGSIDDLRVYNDVLTTGEITELYNLKPVFAGTQTSAYSSLVSWYRIEEDSEPTVFADSKGSNPMTLYNTNYYSLPEDGVDQGLRCYLPTRNVNNKAYNTSGLSYGLARSPTITDINLDTFTVSMWIKTNTTSYHSMLWSFNPTGGASNTSMRCAYIVDGGGYFWWMRRWRPVGESTNLTDSCQSTPGAVNYHDNNWHHIVCTLSGNSVSDNMKLYIDNTLIDTDTTDATGGKDFSEIDNITLSAAHTGNQYIWWAKAMNMDDLRIYNRELTVSEIAELYATK